MAFTRDDIAAYEKQAPAVVADTLETAFTPAAAAPAPAAAPQPAATAPDETVTEETAAGESPASADPDPAAPGGESSAETTADSATANTQPEGETSTTEENGNQPPPKGSARERIEDLVSERNALRKYIEYREQLWNTEGKKPAAPASPETPAAKPATAPAAQPAADDPRPTLEKFDFDLEAYGKAEGEWIQRQIDRGVDRKLGAVKEEEKATAAQAEATRVRAAFEENAAKFESTHSDFRAVILNPALPRLAPVAAAAMVRSDQSAAILYHLGKHVDEAARIARMAPEQQLMAIGRIEAKVGAPQPTPTPAPKPAPKQKTVSQAPPPPTPVAAGGVAAKDPSTMSMDEFVAHERQQEANRRAARAKMRQAMR